MNFEQKRSPTLPSLIRDLAASTPEMIAVFSDEALVRAALRFEASLAGAQVTVGLMTTAEAEAVKGACLDSPDISRLAAAAAHAGTLAIPLVEYLRAKVAPEIASRIHMGATSQDVADTALALQAKDGLALLQRDATRLLAALKKLAESHAATPMTGRTLLQAARPITFGLKAANWALGVQGALTRIAHEQGALTLQFGGASGTLDGQRGRGEEVASALAETLDLTLPPMPWHSRREGVAGLGTALAILTGSVGKIAGDIALLAQTEIAEASEPRTAGRGGSSAMPHKHNSTGCQIALSASLRAPHLAATLLSALPQQHERGIGGWQAEGPVLVELFLVAHGALAAMVTVVEGLEVDVERMAANLATADIGEDTGEAQAMTQAALLSLNGDR